MSLKIFSFNQFRLWIKNMFGHKRSDNQELIFEQRIQWLPCDQKSVFFSHQLPFTPDKDQIIYVDDQPCPKARNLIEKNYDHICDLFRKRGYEFIYLPALEAQAMSVAAINYMFPYQHSEIDLFDHSGITINILKQHLVTGNLTGPALLHYRMLHPGAVMMAEGNCDESDPNVKEWQWYRLVGLADEVPPEWLDNHFFSYRLIPDTDDDVLVAFFDYYIQHIANGYLGTHDFFAHTKSVDYGDETSDQFFETSSTDLIREIKERIQELRKRGVHEYQLRSLMESTPTLSRLVITKDFNIFLPDYNNVEIKMTPLPKAVFFLFLRHPDGIMFKKMSEYREELLYLYRQVTRSNFEESVQKSIDDVTDPTKNSINEKCARIREAFLREFDEFYAKYYFITGKRGEPKKILLPTEKVIWEVQLKQNK